MKTCDFLNSPISFQVTRIFPLHGRVESVTADSFDDQIFSPIFGSEARRNGDGISQGKLEDGGGNGGEIGRGTAIDQKENGSERAAIFNKENGVNAGIPAGTILKRVRRQDYNYDYGDYNYDGDYYGEDNYGDYYGEDYYNYDDNTGDETITEAPDGETDTEAPDDYETGDQNTNGDEYYEYYYDDGTNTDEQNGNGNGDTTEDPDAAPTINGDGVVDVPIVFPPTFSTLPPPTGISAVGGPGFSTNSVPPGVQIVTLPNGQVAVQIPEDLKWRDVKDTFTDKQTRKTWRQIFNSVKTLRQQERAAALSGFSASHVTSPTDFQVPSDVTLAAVKQSASSMSIGELRNLKARLRELQRQSRRSRDTIRLRVPASLTGAPSGVTVVASPNGEQIVTIPSDLLWPDVKDSFDTSLERKMWKQVFSARNKAKADLRGDNIEMRKSLRYINDVLSERLANGGGNGKGKKNKNNKKKKKKKKKKKNKKNKNKKNKKDKKKNKKNKGKKKKKETKKERRLRKKEMRQEKRKKERQRQRKKGVDLFPPDDGKKKKKKKNKNNDAQMEEAKGRKEGKAKEKKSEGKGKWVKKKKAKERKEERKEARKADRQKLKKRRKQEKKEEKKNKELKIAKKENKEGKKKEKGTSEGKGKWVKVRKEEAKERKEERKEARKAERQKLKKIRKQEKEKEGLKNKELKKTNKQERKEERKKERKKKKKKKQKKNENTNINSFFGSFSSSSLNNNNKNTFFASYNHSEASITEVKPEGFPLSLGS
ncbi:hypothetical protein C7M84_007208 [Penaeus vannamei]|uniref:Uncharacterized protein n=1 Tax=Penaeus vannamei TaxID=6689 RepID=A0A3R7STG2_PENVA|nr:hypothetical protein C7M84_007208 [Penaeus vannamei]